MDASTFQDYQNPSSSLSSSSSSSTAGDNYFEFFREEKTMSQSHAEDIIFCGKLIPIKQQITPPQNQPLRYRRSRSESMSAVKPTTATPPIKHHRPLKPEAVISRDGSGKKSSSSRHVVLFGLVNVPPPEMDIRDLKNRLRQVRIESIDHRKPSWRVLGFLSCKSSGSTAVATPLSYMARV